MGHEQFCFKLENHLRDIQVTCGSIIEGEAKCCKENDLGKFLYSKIMNKFICTSLKFMNVDKIEINCVTDFGFSVSVLVTKGNCILFL